MSYMITAAVQQQAERVLPEDFAFVLNALEATELPLFSTSTATIERVHLAILHLSAGSLLRFQASLDAAKQDWRDVLVGAGLGNEDWPQILHSRGIIPSLLP